MAARSSSSEISKTSGCRTACGSQARGAHLDQVGAGGNVLADAVAERLGALHTDPLEIARSSADAEPRSRGDDPRSDDRAAGNLVAQFDVRVIEGAEILDRGESRHQRR